MGRISSCCLSPFLSLPVGVGVHVAGDEETGVVAEGDGGGVRDGGPLRHMPADDRRVEREEGKGGKRTVARGGVGGKNGSGEEGIYRRPWEIGR
ncbi:hypothetical protein NL676_013826 [Syzygium grande]|nr:hypothetical protein NL676_013826 [Syzygium grande]